MRIDLSGQWALYVISPDDNDITTPAQLEGLTPVAGNVPGNLELDLFSAGLAKDPFYSENARDFRKFEFYNFWYQKEFSVPPEMTGQCELIFEGVGCFAEYFLNGQLIGKSANALIPFTFPVEVQAKNTLCIRIISSEIEARKFPDEPAAISHMPQVYSTLYVRKPAHVSGWDIAPRLQLGGVWKKVLLLKEKSDFKFTEIWLNTLALRPDDNAAEMRLYYRFEAGQRSLHHFKLRFSGRCGDSSFTLEEPAYFTNGTIDFRIQAPKLWNPRGYGEPNLYDLHAQLYDGNAQIRAEFSTVFGIRTIHLDRTDVNTDGNGKFTFVINGVPVRVLGSNHVPLDALHSRDVERMKPVLDLFDELQCNMIRCWGGGVYESDEFFDYCDRHGIMVWQDFMFGCAIYPQNPVFFDMVRPEAEYTVRRLRRHASLIVWCGDNECDQFYLEYSVPLKYNELNRNLLAGIVRRLDPSRPYLPSSPYVSEEAEKHVLAGNLEMMPERHLWGPRETFKLPFYYAGKARFISETGWHGCPNLSSLRKFLSPEHILYDDKDCEWDFHASNPFRQGSYMGTRSQLIGKQLEEYFRSKPETLEEYARYSQIHQAEACKFMVETARLDPHCGGILWWNLIDCWPQFSDAVVDYYYGKKLAFYYLKRCQSSFCILCSEPNPWSSEITAVNDSCQSATGSYTLQTEHDETLSGEFELAPYSRKVLGKVRSPRGNNELWLLQWVNHGVKGANHYISGNAAMDYQWYMKRLNSIAALDDTFDAAKFAL